MEMLKLLLADSRVCSTQHLPGPIFAVVEIAWSYIELARLLWLRECELLACSTVPSTI
jgi:hypothetical protein